MTQIKRLAKPFTLAYRVIIRCYRITRAFVKMIKHTRIIQAKIKDVKSDKSTLKETVNSFKPIISEIDRVMSSPEALHDTLSSVINKIQHTVQTRDAPRESGKLDNELQFLANKLHSLLDEGLGTQSNDSRIIEAEYSVQRSHASKDQLNNRIQDLDELSLDTATPRSNQKKDDLS